jgi:hypothetical protein
MEHADVILHYAIAGGEGMIRPACQLRGEFPDYCADELRDLYQFRQRELHHPRCRACLDLSDKAARTNEGRRELALARRRNHWPTKTPLMSLATQLYLWNSSRGGMGADWARVPQAILDAAFVHCEERAGRAHLDNARGRATAKWIGTWVRRISDELERRERAARAARASVRAAHVVVVSNATTTTLHTSQIGVASTSVILPLDEP